ncbi:glycoside hydrolase family 2 TIM barrel-domain containing protein [Chitinophaga lutea]
MTRFYFICALLFALYVPAAAQFRSLEGRWDWRPDPGDAGLQEKWQLQRFDRHIQLPGTLDDAGYGDTSLLSAEKLEKEVLLHLTRHHRYVGPAWYHREVDIPKGYNTLVLERVIWETTAWMDGQLLGKQESLSAPHVFTGLKPGRHVIVLRIDNRKRYDISHKDMAHAYTDETQIIWNGVIGRIGLEKSAPKVQIYPDAAQKRVRVQLSEAADVRLLRKGKTIAQKQLRAGEHFLPLDAQPVMWNEFRPEMYTLEVNGRPHSFGIRQWENRKGLLYLNGKRVFLRGTLDCNIFPLTGHPPMTEEGWAKEFAAVKAYGLNHIRFHSWCPPEAAFRMADSLGVYLQIELPLWALNVGQDTGALRFLEEEAIRIIDTYGNHPSFCFWSMGNELQGDFSWLQRLTQKLRKLDDRRMYATTTFTFQKDYGAWPLPEDDFFVTQWTKKGWIRGQGVFNTYAPDFRKDYKHAIDSMPVPLISHEIGQYSVFPDLKEIDRYTGVLEPRNMKAIRHVMGQKGLLAQAPDFTMASGRLAALLYKEEIERALKTPGFSGFQLLDLQDFPGQGTALVGLLNAFWDSKGLITPEAFRQFCGPVVPLLRFEKPVYTEGETFSASAELACFTDEALPRKVEWQLNDGDAVLAKGAWPLTAQGAGTIVAGELKTALPVTGTARRLTVRLQVPSTSYKNEWSIWVYPAAVHETPAGVVYTRSLDTALSMLAAGGKVLFNPDTASFNGVPGRFASVFWSPVHFPNQPGTMGLLCDPQHPALHGFPTDAFTNWQWWDMVTHSKAICWDARPDWKPIVQVVDNFVKNRRLGMVFEARSGKGQLLICTADIGRNLEKRPAARQLRRSLLSYLASPSFRPAVAVEADELKAMLTGNIP